MTTASAPHAKRQRGTDRPALPLPPAGGSEVATRSARCLPRAEKCHEGDEHGVTGPRLQAKAPAGASGLELIEDPEQDSDHPDEQPAKATDGNEGSTSQRADTHTECRAAPAQDRNAMDHDEGTYCGDPCESR